MEPEEPANVFVDHKETQIQVPRPRRLNSSGIEITTPEDVENSQSELATQSHVTTTHISQVPSASTTTVRKHVTTIYTQRISGRSSSSSSESGGHALELGGGDASAESGCSAVFTEREEVKHEEAIPRSGFVFGPNSLFDGERAGEIHFVRHDNEAGDGQEAKFPTEVCSIAVSVAAGVTSSTTTVYSRIFDKTVDTTSTTTTTEFSSTAGKERHLSECSFSMSGVNAPEVDQGAGDDNAFVSGPDTQERREDSILVSGSQTTEQVGQQAKEDTALLSSEDSLNFSQEAQGSSVDAAELPTYTYSQESRGDSVLFSEHNTQQFVQESSEMSVPGQGPNTIQTQSQETRGDSLLGPDPNTLQFTEETGAGPASVGDRTESYSQEGRDSSLPAASPGTTERTEGDAAVLAPGFSVHAQNQEYGEGLSVPDTDLATTVKTDEKEVSEYCPGLAIRTLTLEDLKEKRTSPERISDKNEDVTRATQDAQGMLAGVSTEMGVSQLVTTAETATFLRSSRTSGSRTASGQILMQCTDDTTPAPHRPSQPVEVERKFTVTDDTENRLKSLGAQLDKEKVFTDVYFDNDDYSLILTDCWLRRRNNAWEVKMPVTPGSSDNAMDKPATQYRELKEEKEISAWLVDRLQLDAWLRGDPVDLLVQAAGLTEFARFTTTRRSYTLQSFTVDLDLTDHGFHVGEIEVMAASLEEVPKALKTLSDVAEQLGLCPLKLM